MPLPIRDIRMLVTESGDVPFEVWLASILDFRLQAAVDARLTRIMDGNFGDHKSVGDGVYELRIHKGPGLRVYYALEGQQVVLLIGGGSKKTQIKDIKNAKLLWEEYRNAH